MIFALFVAVGVCGLLVGSFLNAWIWRLKTGRSVARGRSMCPHCLSTIPWFDLFPVISFIVLRGRCRSCHKKIDWQYPLVETWMMLSYVAVFAVHGGEVGALLVRDLVAITLLTGVFVYDLRHGEIHDVMTTIPGLIYIPLALVFGWGSWMSILFGAAIGAGVFLFQYLLSHGRWVGGGDIRLGFFMGVVLGFPKILVALLTAYLLGAIISLVLLGLKKVDRKSTTPFGTYLSVGTVVALFAGGYIIEWYLGFL